MKYYEVQRDLTCKSIGSKELYGRYDQQIDKFATIKEVKSFLKEHYYRCKKVKIYRDTKKEDHKHTGYIYRYRTPKYSYDDTPKINEDWVEVKEIKATTIII